MYAIDLLTLGHVLSSLANSRAGGAGQLMGAEYTQQQTALSPTRESPDSTESLAISALNTSNLLQSVYNT